MITHYHSMPIDRHPVDAQTLCGRVGHAPPLVIVYELARALSPAVQVLIATKPDSSTRFACDVHAMLSSGRAAAQLSLIH